MKHHAPATLRNREAILAVLQAELTGCCKVLEIASGSGEHAVYFAQHLPQVQWQPSDPDPRALSSIKAYRAEYREGNLESPIALNAADAAWPPAPADAVLCINMAHISEWATSLGLMAGAARVLGKSGGPLIIYGPFFENGVEPAPSNLEFDASLKSRNPAWGIRHVEQMDQAGEANGLSRSARYEMPANNLALVYRRV